MQTHLHAALDQSLVQTTLERTLRLLITNIPRYPDDTHLRRLVVDVVREEGLIGETFPVLQRAFELDLAAGRLLGVVATIRLGESVGFPVEHLWTELSQDVLRRPMGPAMPSWPGPDAEPELQPIRPMLGRDGLLHVAVEMAARASDQTSQPAWHTVPVLSDLAPQTLFDVLRSLRVRRLEPGQLLAPDPESTPAWWVRGSVQQPGDEPLWLPEGAFHDPLDPVGGARAASACVLLEVNPAEWRALRELPELTRALARAREALRVTRAVQRSLWLQQLSDDGVGRFLSTAVAFRAPAGVLRPWGEPSGGIGLVLDGEVHLIDRGQTPASLVATLLPGDSFGGESAACLAVARLELSCRRPVQWAWVDDDGAEPLLADEPAAALFLVRQAEARMALLTPRGAKDVDVATDEEALAFFRSGAPFMQESEPTSAPAPAEFTREPYSAPSFALGQTAALIMAPSSRSLGTDALPTLQTPAVNDPGLPTDAAAPDDEGSNASVDPDSDEAYEAEFGAFIATSNHERLQPPASDDPET